MPGRIRGSPLHSRPADSQIDALLRAYQGDVPGASLLVLHEGEAIVRRAYGYADLEHQSAADGMSNYRLASLTKQFTAAAVLLLVEEGRLSLDAGIRAWLPTFSRAPCDGAGADESRRARALSDCAARRGTRQSSLLNACPLPNR
jgi:CubicO group peptidase (beta-lactamase class C family)